MSKKIPLEVAAEVRTHEMVASHVGMQAFLATLTSEQQRRFTELTHHIYHEGVEDGMTRQSRELPIDRKVALLIHETQLFAEGARTYQQELGQGEQ